MLVFSTLCNYAGILCANLLRACRINSLKVSYKALRNSVDVQVLDNSSIDKNSNIGSYTYIGCNTHITKSNIGRYCSIANNVSIGQGEHNLDRISTSAKFYEQPWDILTAGECEIASDVWIGVDAVILRGVHIGVGAVVAANAVVTKDVPSFAIVAGVPAKIIRYRFPQNVQEDILKSSWWELEKTDASVTLKNLHKELMIE